MPSEPAAAVPRSRSEPGLSRGRRYRHFIFDLDGTVVDSSADLVRATNETLARVGLGGLPAATVLEFVGRGVRRLLERSLEKAAGEPPAQELLARALAVFVEVYGRGLLVQTRPYPGMDRVLRALAARGAALSLLTNKPRAFTAAILRGLRLDALFGATINGDDEVARKPAPDGAVVLVRLFGIPAAQTVLVGDSPEDVETARAAGLASCAVGWGFRSPDELARSCPDHRVGSPEDLLALACAG